MSVKKKNLISRYIKNVFSENDQRGIRAVVNEFKKNTHLKEAYYAINNLQHGVCTEIEDYINHNKKIYVENKVGFASYKYNLKDISDIDASISYILENEKGASNYDLYDRHYNSVKNHLKQNVVLNEQKSKVKDLLSKIESNSDKPLFKRLSESKDKEDFFINYRDTIIMNINTLLAEEQKKEQKLLLYEAREELKTKLYTVTGFVEDVMYMKNLEDILNG